MDREFKFKKERVLTPEEIDFSISKTKAIWGIEGMEMTAEEEAVSRDFLAGKISKEEHRRLFLKEE